MSGRYFRQNHWKKVEDFSTSISYAYLLISYEKENANADFFDQYYPINVVLTKEAISFYSSNLLEYANKNQASLQSYQSQAFLSFSLENPSALEAEIERVDKMTSDEVIENLFTFSTDLNYKKIDKSNESKQAIGADFLASLFPDLNGIEKEDQKEKENQRNYYKIIFLNFLNDFFYSNTFKSHPNYKRTRQILEENKTIKAILAKGYYKYALKKNKELLEEKEVIQKETVKKWKSRLKDAAKNWHALIINADYDDTIKAGTTWFKNKEVEHEKLMKGLFDEKEKVLSTDQVTDSASWLSSRYDLWGAFSNQFWFLYFKDKKAFCFDIIVFVVLFFGGIWLAIKTTTLFSLSLDWGSVTIYSSLLMGWVIILSGFVIVLQKLLLVVYVVVKNLSIQTSKTPITPIVLFIPKFLNLFKPRILLASTAVWAVIYASSELWNIDFVIGGVEVILLVVTLLIFLLFAFYKLKEFTKLNARPLFLRAFILITLGFVYSICLGISATTIAMKNNFVKEGYYKDFFKTLDQDTLDSTTKRTTLQARLDTGNIVLKVASDTTIENTLYNKTTAILYRKVIGKNKLDTIIAYTKPKTNADKILLKEILPLLKKTTSSDKESKLVYYIKVDLPQWSNANSSKPFLFDFYIVPDFLIFYSMIATVIGMFIELFLKEKE